MLWLCAFHFLQSRIGDLSLKENYRYGLGMTQAFCSLFIPLLMCGIAEQLSMPIAEERGVRVGDNYLGFLWFPWSPEKVARHVSYLSGWCFRKGHDSSKRLSVIPASLGAEGY